jgi:hypothetical protein
VVLKTFFNANEPAAGPEDSSAMVDLILALTNAVLSCKAILEG